MVLLSIHDNLGAERYQNHGGVLSMIPGVRVRWVGEKGNSRRQIAETVLKRICSLKRLARSMKNTEDAQRS